VLGIHRTYMGGVERGERNLTLKSVERIAERIGVEPIALLQSTGDDTTRLPHTRFRALRTTGNTLRTHGSRAYPATPVHDQAARATVVRRSSRAQEAHANARSHRATWSTA
jgi:transcriptional regulator with XRE-family HTH domain